MALQGSNPNLQGTANGISLQGPTVNPQQTTNLQIQPAIGIPLGNAPKPVAPLAPAVNTAVSDSQAQINSLLAEIKAQQAAFAPPLNLSSIYTQAGNTAAANVNPYYTKQLNDFIAQQAQDLTTQQQQSSMNIANLQTQLQNTIQGNAITAGRNQEDTATKGQDIATAADQQNVDEGAAFDQARIAQAKQLASQGLTTSGVGAQQVLGSETARNTTEARQAAQTTEAEQQNQLLSTRTLEDLGRSNDLATQSEGQGEQQANFDLNNYIANQGTQLSSEKDTLEGQRLAAVSAETTNQAKLLVNQFIQSISNPAQRQAAVNAYGNLF